MACGFTAFSIVFQSYQENEREMMKNCVQWNLVQSLKSSVSGKIRNLTTSIASQQFLFLCFNFSSNCITDIVTPHSNCLDDWLELMRGPLELPW